MGQRTIRGPGIEIIEHDLSGYTTTNLGTGCLITGFAPKGEDLDPIHITNRSAWELNFGKPTNEAEEYFYNAGMEVLNQGGNLYAAKIPYTNDMAGIYAASKFRLTTNRILAKLDEEVGAFMKDERDEEGQVEYYTEGDGPTVGTDSGRFCINYRSLKDLGLNRLSLIAPEGQEFLSKDLVEEYETGESVPGGNVIYLVDKTRAIYTRAPEVADKQDNRDPRACIGIIPVITTLCNTAYYQSNATGVVSDVPELYQPVRSLRTIQFPAGAASAAEYKATKFVDSDLHTPLMKGNEIFATSLSERAATIAQSCLVNANLVDGKFKPYVCNEVCVVVFKAFVSPEDGKIDFTDVETWIGSLDPNGRDEKGRTTFIDTIINNNSEYIYCFSNLENPERILNPDHGFVVGSDSEYESIKSELEKSRNKEFLASSLFSSYAVRILGFGDVQVDSSEPAIGLAAPRDWMWEATGDVSKYSDSISGNLANIADNSKESLLAFYNQDAKQKVCTLDELVLGKKYNKDEITSVWGVQTSSDINSDAILTVSEKFIMDTPSVTYRIAEESDDNKWLRGEIKFTLNRIPEADLSNKLDYKTDDGYKYRVDEYEENMSFTHKSDGEDTWSENIVNLRDNINKLAKQDLSELTIFNSTDYLRSIYDFEELIDLDDFDLDPNAEDYEEKLAGIRQSMIQALIINSIEKSAKYKSNMRYCKKAQINLDRLNDAYADYKANSSEKSRKYIEELYASYKDAGLLGGIKFSSGKPSAESDSSMESRDTLLEKKDALEAKLDEIINIDTSKKEKMNPRKILSVSRNPNVKFDETIDYKYLLLKVYLTAQYNLKLANMYKSICKILDDCCYAQQRYIESQRNIDDSNIMLGFYPEMAEPIITYSTIAQSLNKILDEMSNIHSSEIDVVCDAGVSNIAQFVKQVYDPSADDGEDIGGIYEPVRYSSYFKFNKNTDLAYWKTIVFKFDTFCKYRGDCMFCTESPRGMVLIGNKPVVRKTKKDTSIDLNILPYLSKIAGINTSFGAGYINWYRTISDFTGDTIWIPPSIKAMGTYILTDKQYNWWDAPAGMKRGVINMAEVSFNPNKDQSGDIYDVNWNYAIQYLNDGIIQEGQKTFQTRQSALDRINVRRLICRIKRFVYFASRQFLYEPHTQETREKYVKTITPFFEDLVNRGGLYDFKIICDSTNNTPDVIDRNELRVKIGVKPVRTIEFIIIDLCTLNTGASWSEMDSI